MIEAKTVVNYSSAETGCDMCLQGLIYKSTENLIKKEAEKLKFIFENIFSKVIADLGLQQKAMD